MASSNQILPQPRLRLMDSERHSFTHWGSVVRRIETLIVKGVAGLVNYCQEPAGEVASVVAQCNAHVAGSDRSAERMRPEVEPAVLEIEPQLLSDSLSESALAIERKLSLVHLLRRRRRSITQSLNQRNEFSSQLRK